MHNGTTKVPSKKKKKKKKKKQNFKFGGSIYEAFTIHIVAKCEFEHTEGEIGEGHLSKQKIQGNPLLVGKVTGLTMVLMHGILYMNLEI